MGKEKPAKKAITISPKVKRIITFSAVPVIASLAVFFLLLQFIVKPANDESFKQATTSLLQQQKDVLSNYKTNAIKQLNSLTKSEALTSFLESPSTLKTENIDNILFDIKQNVLSSFPHAKTTDIYQPGQAQAKMDNGGNISFVELDMIKRVERNETAHPEIAKAKNGNDWEIHWAIPIQKPTNYQLQSTPEPIAILHATTTLEGITEAVSVYNTQEAKIHLSQVINQQSPMLFLVIGQGNSQGKQTADVPLTYWRIEIHPSAFLKAKASNTPLWLIAVTFCLLILGLAAAYFLAMRQQNQEEARYKALETNIVKPGEEKPKEAPENEFSDPLYLSDQDLLIEEEDQALIDGAYQDKAGATEDLPATTQTNIVIPTHIFRSYDIRGLVDEELTLEITEALGKAFASEALAQGETTLLVGFDARTHSASLCEQLTKGIISTGCNVINIGLVPTPLLNFATIVCDQTHSGIIVTASHNPKTYNGFKMVINQHTLVDRDIQKIRERIQNNDVVQGAASGSVMQADFSEEYIEAILSDIVITSDLHIVVDAANGAASELAPKLLKELSCTVTPLFCEFNGEFPHYKDGPDPSNPSNLEALITTVKEKQADLGVAFDGDGDRLIVVTSSGKIIWPDQLLMLFARDVVSRHPGCDIIFDIKSTRQLNQVISGYGGRPIMWKTGHAHIKAKMKETQALLAGEFSGHIFFKERWHGFDDGLYATARLLEIISLREQSLDDMLKAMPQLCSTPEIKIATTEDKKFKIVEDLIKQGDFSNGEKTTFDGLRVDVESGWGLVRASNTSSALTLRFEAEDANALEKLKTLFKQELAKIDSSLNLDF